MIINKNHPFLFLSPDIAGGANGHQNTNIPWGLTPTGLAEQLNNLNSQDNDYKTENRF